MSENTLLQRLEGLEHKFEEISTLITDPSVIADMKRYVKLNKEYRDLERIVSARKEYVRVLSNIAEAKSILETENDPEMREMAKMELEELEPQLPSMEENIKILLIPSDPEDSKNAIVEIRGGTGGDEAALFAGDLYKMYAKYYLPRHKPCHAIHSMDFQYFAAILTKTQSQYCNQSAHRHIKTKNTVQHPENQPVILFQP